GWAECVGRRRASGAAAAPFRPPAGCRAGMAPGGPEPARGAPRQGLWHEASRGGAVLARDPLLRALSLADASAAFAFRAYSAVFLLFVTRELGCAPGVLGLVFAVGGLASFGGALAAGRAGRALGPTRTVAVGLG